MSLDHYVRKTFYKTASLMANSGKAIAILGGQEREVAELAWEYGRHVGLAFQVSPQPSETARQAGSSLEASSDGHRPSHPGCSGQNWASHIGDVSELSGLPRQDKAARTMQVSHGALALSPAFSHESPALRAVCG